MALPHDAAERWALAILRVSLGVFLLLWAIEKLVIPETTVGIWSHFYGMSIGGAVPAVLGVLEVVLALAIVVGLWRRWSYGLGLVLHAVSVVSTWRQLIDPWGLLSGGKPNHLFLAGIPVLAGFVALYLLRERDVWTIDGWRARRRGLQVGGLARP